MTDCRISILEGQLRRLRSGEIAQFRRPGALMAARQPGDRLWIAEPFHLESRYDDVAPLQALKLGSERLWFAVDPHPAEVGRRRTARELPKERHRSHLIVHAVRAGRLQDANEEDLRAEGFASRVAFADAWTAALDYGRSMSGDFIRWSDNPDVTVLRVEFVDAPLAALPDPDGPKRPRSTPVRRIGGTRAREAALERFEARVQQVSEAQLRAAAAQDLSLSEQIRAECQARSERFAQASRTAMEPIDLDRPPPPISAAIAGDQRPLAWGRDACPFCGVRGDLGCKHFRPAEQVFA
jgi:hypothetical protein